MDNALNYSSRTLIGNWFEQRRSDAATDHRETMHYTSVSHAAHTHLKVPPPHKKTQLITMNSLQRVLHNHQAGVGGDENNDNATAPAAAERRTLLPRHPPGHDQRILYTTSHSSYGGPHADSHTLRHRDQEVAANAASLAATSRAGLSNYRASIKTLGTRFVPSDNGTPCVDEVFKLNEPDPKRNTVVQRAWMPSRDLVNLKANMVRQNTLKNGFPVPATNVKGMGLTGLGDLHILPHDHAQRRYVRANDCERHGVGVWSG